MDDTLNYNSNGGVFYTSGPCATGQGPQWQNGAAYCSYWYVFGAYETVGYSYYGNIAGPLSHYYLSVFRMMVSEL